MKNILINGIKWTLIAALLVVVYFWRRDIIDEALIKIANMPIWVTVLSVSLAILYFVFEGKVISGMTVLEEKPMRWIDGFRCAFFCAFYRLITLGAGAGISEAYFYTKSGFHYTKALGMTLVQYTFHKIVLGALGLISFILLLLLGQSGIVTYAPYMALGTAAITAIVTFLIILSVSKKLADFLVFLIEKILTEKMPFYKKKDEFILNVRAFNNEGREIWKHKEIFVSAIILNLLKFISWNVIPGIVFMSEGRVNLIVCIAIMSVVSMVSSVMVAPSGIGTLEFLFVLLFTTIVSNETAAAAVIVYRFFTWIFPFFIGAIIAGLFKGKEKTEAGETA